MREISFEKVTSTVGDAGACAIRLTPATAEATRSTLNGPRLRGRRSRAMGRPPQGLTVRPEFTPGARRALEIFGDDVTLARAEGTAPAPAVRVVREWSAELVPGG